MSSGLKELIFKNAAFYGEKLSDDAIVMHAEALNDLPLERVAWAYNQIARTSRTRRMPLPGDVRALVAPEGQDADADDARDVSSRIYSAIVKFGHTNHEAAKQYIGELGWTVVQREGGWRSVCELVNDDNASILKAQWRELAAVIARKSSRGQLEEPPKLREPSASAGLTRLGAPALPGPKEK